MTSKSARCALGARSLGRFGLLILALAFGVLHQSVTAEDKKTAGSAPTDTDDDGHISRPVIPDSPPDPAELKVRPQPNGKMRFSFYGQPWSAVVEWLAQISGLSLDWQELPSGFVNIRTEREYTVEEARDLINRQLLDRGFTLLKDREILSVVSIKKLDPSLVPWVDRDELAKSQPHDFVRVVFSLETLSAEAAAVEFKSLLSPNGHISPLKSTNRIEAMDAVANLRQIDKVLAEEESPQGQERQVREFKLKHVRAADVQPQLQKLLGLDKAAAAAEKSPDPAALAQQITQLMQQGNQPGAKPATRTGAPAVFIIADPRDNSIIANAPAEQMSVIAQAVKMIDTPPERDRSIVRDTIQTQVYPIVSADPDALLKLLQDLGDLDPATRLQVDRKRRAIVAHAELADHLRIRLLIEKVDGKSRGFRSLRLQDLQADYVASAIDMVMGGGDGAKRAAAASDDEARRFRVVADVERNRLLMWVNEAEYDEVRSLLADLGETSIDEPTGGRGARVHKFPALNITPEVLKRLQEMWPSVAPNPLEIETQPKSPTRSDAGSLRRDSARTREVDSPAAHRPSTEMWKQALVNWLQDNWVGPQSNVATKKIEKLRPMEVRPIEIRTVSREVPIKEVDSPPTVRIERQADGSLGISSDDEQAVELVKKLLGDMSALPGDLKIFRMKHKTASATAIADNLKQILDQKQKNDRVLPRFYDPSAGKWITNARETDSTKLPKPAPPKFIVDSESNSILAVGADEAQLRVIEQVIRFYDVDSMKDPLPKRTTRLLAIKHAQARQIAESVKEVYRDLLAAIEGPPQPGQPPRPPAEQFRYAYASKNSAGEPAEMQVKFKGQLSIALDEPSNMLIVSAPEAVMEDVVRTIEALDEASAVLDQRVKVVRINRNINPQDFHKKIQRIGSRIPASNSSGNNSSSNR